MVRCTALVLIALSLVSPVAHAQEATPIRAAVEKIQFG